MDIQERKRKLLKSFAEVEDETTIEFLEAYLGQKNSPFSQEELRERALLSASDIQRGKYMSQEDLEKESRDW